MALLHSTLLYVTLPWLSIVHSTLLYLLHHGSTSQYLILHYSTFTVQYSTMVLLDSTLPKDDSTSQYLILHYSTVALLHCTVLYHGST